MWNCSKCGELVEDHFQVCWNCQTTQGGRGPMSKSELEDPGEDRLKDLVNRKYKPMNCLRCGNTLEHAGTKKFHHGPNLGVLGDWGELLVGNESLDMYVCTECGHVEFFTFGD